MKIIGQSNDNLEIILTYFKKIDANDESYLELFADDVEFFFPKFGYSRGKDGLEIFGKTMNGYLAEISHDIQNFLIILSEPYVVVEGQESGITRQGEHWPDGKISQGRFCSTFEIRDNKINRMHIYVDPDYTSKDLERINIFQELKK